MIKSKILLCLSAMVCLATFSDAQTPASKIPRIGYLTGSPLASTEQSREAFRQGLQELGYVEGKNILIEWRSYDGHTEKRPGVAAELVRLNVDVIVAVGAGDIAAAKEATSTTPIVMVSAGDPVASGFVASLAKPGGNVARIPTVSQ